MRYAKLLCVLAPAMSLMAFEAGAESKSDLVARAARSYYTLRSHAPKGFQCTLTPDWHALLEGARQSDPGNANLVEQQLAQLHFTLSLDSTGEASVTHNKIKGENPEEEQGLSQIYNGVQLMVTGFFETWREFMWQIPLPQPGMDYELLSDDAGYRIFYKDGDADVTVAMNNDLFIQSLHVRSVVSDGTVQPHFVTTEDGLVMTGYDGNYRGSSQGDTSSLHVNIGYRLLGKSEVPQRIDISESYGASNFVIGLTLSDCTVTAGGG